MDSQQSKQIKGLLKVVPPVITIVIMCCIAYFLHGMTLEQFLSYVPKNYFWAALVLILFYPIKSLSVVFPLSILYLCAGFIFPFWLAFGVTIIGLWAGISVPYWLGRHFGQNLMDTLIQKYPKVNKIFQVGQKNELLVCYILRIVSILPGDLCSLLLGACRINYKYYVIGSLLGFSPVMVVHLLAAQAIDHQLSLPMLLFALFFLGISILSSILINRKIKEN